MFLIIIWNYIHPVGISPTVLIPYISGKFAHRDATVPAITAISSIGTGNLHFFPIQGCKWIMHTKFTYKYAYNCTFKIFKRLKHLSTFKISLLKINIEDAIIEIITAAVFVFGMSEIITATV